MTKKTIVIRTNEAFHALLTQAAEFERRSLNSEVLAALEEYLIGLADETPDLFPHGIVSPLPPRSDNTSHQPPNGHPTPEPAHAR